MRISNEDWCRTYTILCGFMLFVCIVLTLNLVERNTEFKFEVSTRLNRCEAMAKTISNRFNVDYPDFETIEEMRGKYYNPYKPIRRE